MVYIKRKRPKTFILENVQALVTRHSAFFLAVMDELRGWTMPDGKPMYIVDHKIMNAKDYSGVPHNRKRVFVTGRRTDIAANPMPWPAPVPMQDITALVHGRGNESIMPKKGSVRLTNITRALQWCAKKGFDPARTPIVVDDQSSRLNMALG